MATNNSRKSNSMPFLMEKKKDFSVFQLIDLISYGYLLTSFMYILLNTVYNKTLKKKMFLISLNKYKKYVILNK